MTVFKTRKSSYYQYDFQRAGRRYFGSTKCLKVDEAEAFENAQIEIAQREIDASKLASMLPRHVVREPFGEGWRYYFLVPSKARLAGCPVRNQSLGTVFEVAIARAEDELLPAYDAWQAGRRKSPKGVVAGNEASAPPLVGVYMLLLRGKVVYIGSSKQMPKRIAAHRSGSRPFDDVFYISTTESERLRLEAILIKAINPSQNTKNAMQESPDSVPDTSNDHQLTH